MPSAPRTAAPLLPLVLIACGDAGSSDVRTATRDSAGVVIVENSGTGWPAGEGWRVDPEPALEIGVLEGAPEYQLFRVRGARRLADGRIVVANGGTSELRFYSPEGRHLRSVGRQGGGPGEFEDMSWLTRIRGDSLLVYDWRATRLSVFAPDGDFVRSTRVESIEGIPLVLPIGVSADRKLIAESGSVFFSGDARSGITRDTGAVLVYDLEGAFQDTLATFPGDEAYVKSDGRSISVRGRPFGRTLQEAVHGEHLYAGPTDRYEVGVWRTDGTLVRLIRRSHSAVRVTPEDIQAYKEAQMAGVEDQPESVRENRRQLLEEMPYPETFPAFRTLRVDEEGHLWVHEQDRPTDARSLWTVFDPEGALLGQVEMPEGLSVWAIGADWVLGGWRDDLEVEHMRLHRLRRGSGEEDTGSASR